MLSYTLAKSSNPAKDQGRGALDKSGNLPNTYMIEIHFDGFGFGVISKLAGLVTKEALTGFTAITLVVLMGTILFKGIAATVSA